MQTFSHLDQQLITLLRSSAWPNKGQSMKFPGDWQGPKVGVQVRPEEQGGEWRHVVVSRVIPQVLTLQSFALWPHCSLHTGPSACLPHCLCGPLAAAWLFLTLPREPSSASVQHAGLGCTSLGRRHCQNTEGSLVSLPLTVICFQNS